MSSPFLAKLLNLLHLPFPRIGSKQQLLQVTSGTIDHEDASSSTGCGDGCVTSWRQLEAGFKASQSYSLSCFESTKTIYIQGSNSAESQPPLHRQSVDSELFRTEMGDTTLKSTNGNDRRRLAKIWRQGDKSVSRYSLLSLSPRWYWAVLQRTDLPVRCWPLSSQRHHHCPTALLCFPHTVRWPPPSSS